MPCCQRELIEVASDFVFLSMDSYSLTVGCADLPGVVWNFEVAQQPTKPRRGD